MLRPSAPHLLLAAMLAAGLAACSGGEASDGAASPAGAPPPVIKERQANFKAIGADFKAVRGALEADSPDFALIAGKAGQINANALKIAGHFPSGTSVDEGFDTEALPSIWKQPEEFKAAAKKLADESASLAVVAGSSDKAAVAAQAMAVGATCKGCHDKFRLDEETK